MTTSKGFIFDFMEQFDYENLFLCQEKSLGLKAVIAIHDKLWSEEIACACSLLPRMTTANCGQKILVAKSIIAS